MLIAVGVLTVLLLTGATGYFVAQEFAYVAVDRGALRELADAGDPAAARALEITRRLSFTLSGAQLGITVTALLVGYVSEPYLGEGLAEVLGFTGLSTEARLSVSVVVALLFSTFVQMVLGELGPKNLAIARPVPLARALSRSTLIYLTLAGPLIRLFDTASNRLLRAVGIEPVDELAHGATPEDLHSIIGRSHADGLLDEDLVQLLERGLAFGHLRADQVMTPRIDVRVLRTDDPASRLTDLLGTGSSRFPVVGSNVDDVVGVVSVAELLGLTIAERGSTTVGQIAIPPLMLPGSLPLPTALQRLRTEHRQLAIVVDEYGGFAGVISFEDVAEEVVGEILDEDDLDEPVIHVQADGSWLVPARLRLDEVTQQIDVPLPEDELYDTVSGLVLHRLGRTATVGDRVEVSWPTRTARGEPATARALLLVTAVERHVPSTVKLRQLPVEVEAS